jgi:phosphodiesterase/alkaline phosphatase D-like protein
MRFKVLAAFFATCVIVWAQTAGPVVGGVWSGNISPTSATVATRLAAAGVRVRLQVSTSPTLVPAIYSSAVTTTATSGAAAKLTVQGLQPDTEYYYGLEIAGVLRSEENTRGRFRTFPLGRGSFKIAFGSCGDFRHPDQSAYEAILRERPLIFLNTGDLHYSDTNSTVADDYRVNYDAVLGHSIQGALYRGVPVAYMWDDHDFCGNDTDTTAIGRDTARSVYRERVPHYPIASAGGAIGQAFTIGRVRVIMTDLRSASVSPAQKESASKTRMGTAQKAWFKQELINARDAGFPLVLWVCPDPWIAPAALGDDTWGGHATERTEIANFIRDNRISNVVLLSGDMHGLAFDDGTNSDYATGGGAPLTVLHGAALSSPGSYKGGPYSGGAIPGSAQYGILEVYDNGGPSVACRFLGMKAGEGAKMTHIFSSSAEASKEFALVNISTLARIASGEDTLVSGFVISGASDRSVLIRAVGPTLAAFGVAGALSQPSLAVYKGDQQIATNDGWARRADGSRSADVATRMTAAFDRAGAFRLLDEESRDAALMLSLPPGAYTVRVRSASNTPGSTLLEVYDLP